MNDLFADTLYGIALTNPADQWHQQATAAKKRRPEARLVTTEGVLLELLAFFSTVRTWWSSRTRPSYF